MIHMLSFEHTHVNQDCQFLWLYWILWYWDLWFLLSRFFLNPSFLESRDCLEILAISHSLFLFFPFLPLLFPSFFPFFLFISLSISVFLIILLLPWQQRKAWKRVLNKCKKNLHVYILYILHILHIFLHYFKAKSVFQWNIEQAQILAEFLFHHL